LVVRKKVTEQWKRYKETRKHKGFFAQWISTKAVFMANSSLEAADELLGFSKWQMEPLTYKPYREWTATEIDEHLDQPEVIRDFRKIELIIYANRPADDVEQACQHLEEISTSTYHQKIEAYHEHE